MVRRYRLGLAEERRRLEEAVLASPELVSEIGYAMHRGRRVRFPDPDAEPLAGLTEALRGRVQRYAEEAWDPEAQGPRPDEAVLGAWVNVFEGEGYERPHLHPEGWVSGVLYVRLPERPGDLEFGVPPEALRGPGGAPGLRIVPEEGSLVLFPSYLFHHTHPTRCAGLRISLAFDVSPTGLPRAPAEAAALRVGTS